MAKGRPQSLEEFFFVTSSVRTIQLSVADPFFRNTMRSDEGVLQVERVSARKLPGLALPLLLLDFRRVVQVRRRRF